MANEHGQIGFYFYEPRGIIPLDERFTVRRSLRNAMKKEDYRIALDTSPSEVLRACSRIGEVPEYELWLSDEMINLYLQLFEMGFVHTVEVWKDNQEGASELVGGLYGLSFGAAFCGESMFSRAPFASQIALVHLVQRLRDRGFQLLDAQMSSDHLKQFGLIECGQKEYLEIFNSASNVEAIF
jgi:leucyl/phenylalanyl-tRNA--protein transferase